MICIGTAPRRVATSLCLLAYGSLFCGFAQNRLDSIQKLREVVVTAKTKEKEVRSTTPLQILTTDKIEQLNVLQLSDAVKYFSGVTVKDYGGVGGLKTVSVRSLGANHTAVGYDGITLSDCQTGQIDIGKFSLDNVENISLNAGQSDDIFQTARMFAAAGVLNVKTSAPLFDKNRLFSARITLKGGSFGLVNPRLLFASKLSKNHSITFNGEWMYSDGRYPYTLNYGQAGDSTARKKRKNTDVKTLRGELGWYGELGNKSKIHLQSYYYQSERGLPGATVFDYDYASQRLWDNTFFAQANFEHTSNKLFSWQLNGKYNRTYQRYLDPDYLGSDGRQENKYWQQEYYLAGSLLFKPSPHLSFSWASDGAINTMDAVNLPSFAYPSRYSLLNVVAGKYVTERLTVVGNLLSTLIDEQVHYEKDPTYKGTHYGEKGTNQHRLTPSFSLSYKLLSREDLRVRLMYKEIFRMPTFNDLYYSRVGNPDLRPEYTWQYNAGLTWMKQLTAWLPLVSVTIDSYYNKVKDKIIAIPTKNIFEWSMQNIGKVDIYGTDATIDLQLKATPKWLINLSATYTRQKAWDVTSKTAPGSMQVYKHQIAYTPENSGSARASIENPWVNVSYTMLFSGARYVKGENLPANYLKGYTDQTISFAKKWVWHGQRLAANVEILNLFDTQYDIIRYFPMPGRSYRCTLTWAL